LTDLKNRWYTSIRIICLRSKPSAASDGILITRLQMNAADMTALDFSHQRHAAQDAMSASSLGLGSSPFANPLFTYPTIYNSMSSNYDTGHRYAGRSTSYGTNVSPQQIFGHYPTAYPEDATLNIQWSGHEIPDLESSNSPSIKIEATSQDTLDFDFGLHTAEDVEVPGYAEGEGLGTDVDTLMRAIQSKVKRTSHQPQSSTEFLPSSGSTSSDSCSSATSVTNRSPSKAKRRYPCKIQPCAKVFTQKTHLEIHMRAHTGYKPYVRVPYRQIGKGSTNAIFLALQRDKLWTALFSAGKSQGQSMYQRYLDVCPC
jgi:hypothetical protein